MTSSRQRVARAAAQQEPLAPRQAAAQQQATVPKQAVAKLQAQAEQQPSAQADAPQQAAVNLTVGCGDTMGCFSSYGSQVAYVMMTQGGVEYLRVLLQSTAGFDWIALGFANQQGMVIGLSH